MNDMTVHLRGADLAWSTKGNYSRQWRVFKQWCHINGYDPTTATSVVVGEWLEWRLEQGLAGSSIEVYLAGVIHQLGLLGTVIDRNHPRIKNTLAGIHASSRPPKSAQPVPSDELSSVISGLTKDDPTDVRDGVAILLLAAFQLRRNELANVNWKQGESFIRLTSDGIELSISGANHIIAKKQAPALHRLLSRWVNMGSIKPGTPLLRAVRQNGFVCTERLSPKSINARIQERFPGHTTESLTIFAEAHIRKFIQLP